MITRDQYLYFLSRALEGMAEIVGELGDDLANRKLPPPGSNSPYAVLNHCLGAVGYWVGEVVGGRPAHRDRDAEFTASGPVGPLLERVRETIESLDLRDLEPRTPVGGTRPGITDQGSALFHLYTDVVQHRGQLEITRDVLVAG